MYGSINPYELNVKGDLYEFADTGTTEEIKGYSQKTGSQYDNMAMSEMSPRGSETYEAGQQVGEQRATFKLMKFNRDISKKDQIRVGSDKWEVEGVRNYKGFNNILLVDVKKKDNA